MLIKKGVLIIKAVIQWGFMLEKRRADLICVSVPYSGLCVARQLQM